MIHVKVRQPKYFPSFPPHSHPTLPNRNPPLSPNIFFPCKSNFPCHFFINFFMVIHPIIILYGNCIASDEIEAKQAALQRLIQDLQQLTKLHRRIF